MEAEGGEGMEAVPDPIEVAAVLRGRGPIAFLDGALDADGLGRRSWIGADPAAALFAWGDRLLEVGPGGRRRRRGDPFAALEERVAALPPQGRAIGWLGYELGRQVERLPWPADDTALVPDLAFWFFDDVLAWDREERRWSGGSPRMREALREAAPAEPQPPQPPLPDPSAPPPTAGDPLVRDFTPASYVAAVERVRDYIRAGDIYQVNLSQRFRGRLSEDPFQLYRRIRARRPAPLGAYIEAGSRAVLSNSPELFLRVSGGDVETRPIKGTRPRGATPEEDARLARELLASAKDRAELTMIVDLMRNDLGKVAETGSVRVEGLARRLTLPTVHHLVATVRARLRPGVGPASLLRATFPGGSITGCPKVRSMQRIAELEPCRRGVYTGAIGWLAPGGDLCLSVAIRTLTAARGRFSFHSGGGVVYDSDAAAEHQETLDKARAWLEALGVDRG